MSGYLIPEVWCDVCLERNVSEDEGTLRDHRQYLRDDCGWKRKRPTTPAEKAAAQRHGTHQRLIDVCPDCQDGAAAGGVS